MLDAASLSSTGWILVRVRPARMMSFGVARESAMAVAAPIEPALGPVIKTAHVRHRFRAGTLEGILVLPAILSAWAPAICALEAYMPKSSLGADMEQILVTEGLDGDEIGSRSFGCCSCMHGADAA